MVSGLISRFSTAGYNFGLVSVVYSAPLKTAEHLLNCVLQPSDFGNTLI